MERIAEESRQAIERVFAGGNAKGNRRCLRFGIVSAGIVTSHTASLVEQNVTASDTSEQRRFVLEFARGRQEMSQGKSFLLGFRFWQAGEDVRHGCARLGSLRIG